MTENKTVIVAKIFNEVSQKPGSHLWCAEITQWLGKGIYLQLKLFIVVDSYYLLLHTLQYLSKPQMVHIQRHCTSIT